MGVLNLIKNIFDVGYSISHTKNWYASKTIWFNILVIVSYFLVNNFGKDFITKDEMDSIALTLSILGNIFLRFKTRRPIALRSKGDSDPDSEP